MPTMLRLMHKYGLQQPAGTTKPRLEECQGIADRDFSWRDDAGINSDGLIQFANDVTHNCTIFWNVLNNTAELFQGLITINSLVIEIERKVR